MKYLFIILLFITNLTYGQIVIDKCLGIPFGSSKSVVKQKMGFKIGCVFNSKDSKGDTLIFNGMKVDGRKTTSIIFKFVNDQFYECNIYLLVEGLTPTELYNQVKEQYNKEYFTSIKNYEQISYKFEGKQELKYGITYWDNENDKNSNFITVEVKKDVKITYRNTVLYKKTIKNKNSTDIK